ncbi:MAG: putative transport system ATP-binding protein [Abditibacteriota bacterium]|nr:putative transport system ATP-binding protein [Abditibacteriota bacterium]
MPHEALIEVRGVTKSYQADNRTVHALQGIDMSVSRGQFVAIVGRSGCGKSTLLNLLGGLDQPTSGDMLVAGRNLATFSEADFTRYRRDVAGIVFQFFNLLPLLTVRENAALPALLAGVPRSESFERADRLLQSVGLEHRLQQQASLLSGGEQQRVAIARALINDPQLVLADEPTGNLDSQSAGGVLDALRELCRSQNKTVLMVTHSREAAAIADRIEEMRDGQFI